MFFVTLHFQRNCSQADTVIPAKNGCHLTTQFITMCLLTICITNCSYLLLLFHIRIRSVVFGISYNKQTLSQIIKYGLLSSNSRVFNLTPTPFYSFSKFATLFKVGGSRPTLSMSDNTYFIDIPFHDFHFANPSIHVHFPVVDLDAANKSESFVPMRCLNSIKTARAGGNNEGKETSWSLFSLSVHCCIRNTHYKN